MSLVVCVATNGKIIMAGDTQTNDDNGPTSITATKVFPLGKDVLVGITGKYATYIDVVNARNQEEEIFDESFERKVNFVRNIVQKAGRDNNVVIAGLDNGIAKLVTMGKEYGYYNKIEEVRDDASVKVLMPPGVTIEMCQRYINSLNNLRKQVIDCIEQVSKTSDTVNDKVCGLETDGNDIVLFTSKINYQDIDIRIEY